MEYVARCSHSGAFVFWPRGNSWTMPGLNREACTAVVLCVKRLVGCFICRARMLGRCDLASTDKSKSTRFTALRREGLEEHHSVASWRNVTFSRPGVPEFLPFLKPIEIASEIPTSVLFVNFLKPRSSKIEARKDVENFTLQGGTTGTSVTCQGPIQSSVVNSCFGRTSAPEVQLAENIANVREKEPKKLQYSQLERKSTVIYVASDDLSFLALVQFACLDSSQKKDEQQKKYRLVLNDSRPGETPDTLTHTPTKNKAGDAQQARCTVLSDSALPGFCRRETSLPPSARPSQRYQSDNLNNSLRSSSIDSRVVMKFFNGYFYIGLPSNLFLIGHR